MLLLLQVNVAWSLLPPTGLVILPLPPPLWFILSTPGTEAELCQRGHFVHLFLDWFTGWHANTWRARITGTQFFWPSLPAMLIEGDYRQEPHSPNSSCWNACAHKEGRASSAECQLTHCLPAIPKFHPPTPSYRKEDTKAMRSCDHQGNKTIKVQNFFFFLSLQWTFAVFLSHIRRLQSHFCDLSFHFGHQSHTNKPFPMFSPMITIHRSETESCSDFKVVHATWRVIDFNANPQKLHESHTWMLFSSTAVYYHWSKPKVVSKLHPSKAAPKWNTLFIVVFLQ